LGTTLKPLRTALVMLYVRCCLARREGDGGHRYGAQGETRRRQLAAIERFARLLEGDRGASNTALMAVGAATGLLFDEIQAGRAARLPERLPDLLFALLVPYLGPREAAAEMRSVATQPTASR
jgi:hypothetical protein